MIPMITISPERVLQFLITVFNASIIYIPLFLFFVWLLFATRVNRHRVKDTNTTQEEKENGQE
jgi:hypothetical protein